MPTSRPCSASRAPDQGRLQDGPLRRRRHLRLWLHERLRIPEPQCQPGHFRRLRPLLLGRSISYESRSPASRRSTARIGANPAKRSSFAFPAVPNEEKPNEETPHMATSQTRPSGRKPSSPSSSLSPCRKAAKAASKSPTTTAPAAEFGELIDSLREATGEPSGVVRKKSPCRP